MVVKAEDAIATMNIRPPRYHHHVTGNTPHSEKSIMVQSQFQDWAFHKGITYKSMQAVEQSGGY